MSVRLGVPDSKTSGDNDFVFRFPPDAEHLSQDEEWFSVKTVDGWRRIRLHDYAEIYRIKGLYEALVYDELGCRSPRHLIRLLRHVLDIWSVDPQTLRVMDLGAGNGVVAERMNEVGVTHMLGVDILPEAAAAARRDRPEAYEDYVVTDLTDPDPGSVKRFRSMSPNCLVTVAALGFGDIPPEAFRTACNEIETPGWVALTIKEDFLSAEDPTGFAQLIRRVSERGILSIEGRLRMIHRVALSGEPIIYVGLVGRKLHDIPEALLD